MEVAGGISAIVTIIGGVTTLAKRLNEVKEKYENVALYTTLACGQLSSMRAALEAIRNWRSSTTATSDLSEQLHEDLDVSLKCCAILIDTINAKLGEAGYTLGLKRKIRYLWLEDTLKAYISNLEGQVGALSLLLIIFQCRNAAEQSRRLELTESRAIFKRVCDETSSLSLRTAASQYSASPLSEHPSFCLDVDSILLRSGPYLNAYGNARGHRSNPDLLDSSSSSESNHRHVDLSDPGLNRRSENDIKRDEDFFDTQCEQLYGHVQQWVLRFPKFSDGRAYHPASGIKDEKIRDRFENAILDGSDVDQYLGHRGKRLYVFMSVVMGLVWEYIFTRYLFGMDREQRQKLKALEKTLLEVGPMSAVNKWRATTLTLLSKRESFHAKRAEDTEAVVQEIYSTLTTLLPPPSHLVNEILNSFRKVMGAAVDLSIEMRTQSAEYMMLPPLQPEYDTNGELVQKVHFNARIMNERSGTDLSNEELEAQNTIVHLVLFPPMMARGNGDEQIVIYPAQVLTTKPAEY